MTKPNEISPKLRSKLEKLLALAERGVGGEKDNAARVLNNLLAKHGMTIDSLADDSRAEYWFKHHPGKAYRVLLNQIIAAVCGSDLPRYNSKSRRYRLSGEVTLSERIEIELKYDAYSSGLKEQLETAIHAFINKHNIFPSEKNDSTVEKPIRSPEEREKIDRMLRMARSMPAIEIYDALPNNSD